MSILSKSWAGAPSPPVDISSARHGGQEKAGQLISYLLHYDRENGLLFWKERPENTPYNKAFNSRYANKIAGKIKPSGHRSISIGRRGIYAHRIVWLLETGTWPSLEIDHINGNPDDNRFSNLRNVPHYRNMQNKKVRRDSRSKSKGVYFSKKDNLWIATVKSNGVRKNLGCFRTIEAAVLAYNTEAAKMHEAFFVESTIQ